MSKSRSKSLLWKGPGTLFYDLRSTKVLFSSLSLFLLIIFCNQVASFALEKEIKSSSNLTNVITKRDACRIEISAACGDRVNVDTISDLEAFDCLLNKERDESTKLTEQCNHALWLFRKELMSNEGFLNQLGPDCAEEIQHSPCSKQAFLPASPHTGIPLTFLVGCVIDNKDQLRADKCMQTVSLVERVMFSDYELIERFASRCHKDIEELKCGRNDLSKQKTQGTQFLPNSQGYTIECLSKEIGSLQTDCAIEILRVAELQADDYHLDRALYFACRDDRERFCPSVSSGNGKVYKCLLKHKMEETMSNGCRDQLYRRQKLGWHDYKASGIIFSCKSEIKKNTCRKGASESDKHVRLSQILLCLENAAHTGQHIDAECLDEMKQHRRELMEDHRVTPELLVDCGDDIINFCKKGKGLNGRTIHCLMDHALMRDDSQRISTQCRARLEDLVKMADVTEDWRVDPVLKQSCQPVVAKSSCHDLPANRIMDCLMHLLSDSVTGPDAHAMTEDCEIALFQIQYFVSRDFPLDSILFSACRVDAENICHISGNWSDMTVVDVSPGPLVLSCLYRNIAGEDDENKVVQSRKVSAECSARVKEVMKQRALSVRLMPEIEEPCLVDLAEKCSESTKNDEELACLQNNLEGLDDECKSAVTAFTKFELKNPTVDPYLAKYCHDAINTKCSSHVSSKPQSNSDEDEEDNLFECLVKAKPDIKSKLCRTTLDHYQLMQLKNIEFSPKFKTLCHSDVVRHCNEWHGQLKTSTKLVSCLSQMIWNDTISDSTPRISKGCRKQVKYLILSKIQIESKVEQGTIYSLCGNFVKSLCPDVLPGGGRVFECLRSHRDQLTEQNCYNALFKLEQQVDNDSTLDVHLINECEPEIKQFCAGRTYQKEYNPSLQTQNLIQCLKVSREKEGFTERCEKVLQARLLEQNTDSRLNPVLRKACALDMPKFCRHVPPGHAKIIGCLKKAFVRDPEHLTKSCKNYLEEMLQSAAETDIRLDYTLFKSCEHAIQQSCTSNGMDQSEKVEECLTSLFHNQSLTGTCRDQVQLLIQATQIDIHVDPALNRACAIDLLKICDGVPPGEGRLMACLLNELDHEKSGGESRLHPNCRRLLAARYELFQLAGSPLKLESLEDLYGQVAESQHKNYFLLVGVSMVGAIFIFGLFCGRATRRSKTVSKNK